MAKQLEVLCAAEARKQHAPLMGSAPRVDVWFLIEHPRPWGHKAFEESSIPDEVKRTLTAQASSIPHSCIQLIKHRSLDVAPALSFHVVLSRELYPVRYRFEIQRYDDILDVDIPGVLQELPDYAAQATHEPMFLVCTNGRRDACCAARGLPVYQRLAETVGPAVWQTSHVGGHRFAANLICMPHGIYYGRVDDIDAYVLADQYARGHVYQPAMRGRSCYAPEVQAAAAYLRGSSQLLEVYRIRLDSVTSEEPDQVVVRFAELGGKLHTLRLRVERGALHLPASCGSEKLEPVDLYHLVDYQQEDH